MKQYEGRRLNGKLLVTIDGKALNPRFDLWNHSPTGFEWGYGGSGPAQLALALLADCLEDDKKALNFHQAFKWIIVAELPQNGWILTEDQIHQALQVCRFRKGLYRQPLFMTQLKS
jgi:hypothetical protein